MNYLGMLLTALTVFIAGTVPAFAGVPNPSTGDNSMVALALIIMGVAAAAIVAVLFFTKKKK
ncbi:MAG: LPXTG cell wall anchor domain-containing protein [Angelakisella sp.]|nr:LPXTG cell wall anchor domain-containing protein [Angelakisella sp.]MCI9667406.1 LPXTG cell wall anchor domain-containing protein [Angelakisella sp.]